MKRPRVVGSWADAAVSALLRPLRRGLAARPRLVRRQRRTEVEYVDGLPILVLPDVFNPVRFQSGALLARAARTEVGARPPGQRVLDVGTGSGVAAVFAALRGAEVEAVDVNPQAVRCARLNAQLHHVEDRVDVHEGDLFRPVEGRRFDLVLFNPPFFRARPTTFLEAAVRSEDLVERFSEGLPDVLAPGGRALVVLSTEGEADELVWRLRTGGFLTEEVARARRLGELLVVLRTWR